MFFRVSSIASPEIVSSIFFYHKIMSALQFTKKKKLQPNCKEKTWIFVVPLSNKMRVERETIPNHKSWKFYYCHLIISRTVIKVTKKSSETRRCIFFFFVDTVIPQCTRTKPLRFSEFFYFIYCYVRSIYDHCRCRAQNTHLPVLEKKTYLLNSQFECSENNNNKIPEIWRPSVDRQCWIQIAS